MLADQGSPNGTYLNGIRLKKHAPEVLRAGDVIRVGGLPASVVGEKQTKFPKWSWRLLVSSVDVEDVDAADAADAADASSSSSSSSSEAMSTAAEAVTLEVEDDGEEEVVVEEGSSGGGGGGSGAAASEPKPCAAVGAAAVAAEGSGRWRAAG
mgnify:CR=1 FL=1